MIKPGTGDWILSLGVPDRHVPLPSRPRSFVPFPSRLCSPTLEKEVNVLSAVAMVRCCF